MDASQLTEHLRKQMGLRLDAASGEYLHQRLNQSPRSGEPIPVMGGNARTGVAVRTLVRPDEFSRLKA